MRKWNYCIAYRIQASPIQISLLEVSTICIKANKAAASVTITPYLLIEIDCISFLFIFIYKFVCLYFIYDQRKEFILSFTFIGSIFFSL